MRLEELTFKPKYEEIPIYEDFKILFERITKPELENIVRKSVKMTQNGIDTVRKKIRLNNQIIEVNLLSVELAKRIKGWEGLNGKILKDILPSLDFEVKDDEEVEYTPDGALFLLAYAEIPQDDGSYLPLEKVIFDYVNRFVNNDEIELGELEKK